MEVLPEQVKRMDRTHLEDLQTILDGLPVALACAGLPRGDIQFLNKAFGRLFGYTSNNFPTVVDWIDEVFEVESQRKLLRQRWASLEEPDRSGVSEMEPMECSIRCADGTSRTVCHRATALWHIGVGIAMFEDITDRKQVEEAMRRIAFEDPLTELANRRALRDRWESELLSANPFRPVKMAVVVVDLDGFKPINDQLGHEAGDEVLKEVAGRLRRSVRAKDLVGRVGGDEFVVLLSSLENIREAETICQRIHEVFQAPFSYGGSVIPLGASVGVSRYPDDGNELQALLRHADLALYRRKKSGRGGWEWFSAPAAFHDTGC